MEDVRALPTFDNHYANTTLLGNWQEDRYTAAAAAAACSDGSHQPRAAFTLSGASPQLQEKHNQEWARTNSTYQSDYGDTVSDNDEADVLEGRTGSRGSHIGEVVRASKRRQLRANTAAEMQRPRGLGKELLLGSGDAEALIFSGSPESEEYGAFYWTQPQSGDGNPALLANGGGTTTFSPSSAVSTTMSTEAQDLLFTQTAAARQQSGVRNLYESNQCIYHGGIAPAAVVAAATTAENNNTHTGTHGHHREAGGTANGASSVLTSRFDRTRGASCSNRRRKAHETSSSSSQLLRRTFRDTQGRDREVAHGELMADDELLDRFATTKTTADVMVAHFYFQRRLPPTEA